MTSPPRKKHGDGTGKRRIRNGAEMDVRTAAAYRGISEKTLRAEIERGVVPYRRLHGRIILLKDELDAFLHQLPGVSLAEALANVTLREGSGA